MAKRPKRASLARLVVGLASLAFPLIVTGAAQAGIAGSLPATMSNHPVLRAATATGTTSVEACFDKTLNTNGTTPGDFTLGGYRAGNVSAVATTAPVDPTNTNCVILGFPNTVNTSQYTVLRVTGNGGASLAGSAVLGNTAGLGNYSDSVGLGGESSHSGTIGVTTGPNLVGIVPPSGSNLTSQSLTYVFDKPVGTATATRFFYVDGAGNTCTSGGPNLTTLPSSTITISFAVGATGTCSGVGSAVRAGILSAATTSASDPGSNSVPQSAILPNAPNGGQTTHPDLVSTVLGADGDSVSYTFDKNVVLSAGGATQFVVGLADGATLTSTSAVCTGGTSCIARFNGSLTAGNTEFAVIGFVNGGAVAAADNPGASPNIPGSGGVGGNAGAFARAFTTAPDVFAVNIAKAAGTVTVSVDDRVVIVNTADVQLFTAAGDPISAAAPTPSFNSTAPPGPESITLAYPPSALTNVASVQFLNGAFITNGLSIAPAPENAPAGDDTSINQLVGPVSNASILKAYKAYKAHHAKAIKKAAAKRAKAHRALLKALKHA
jgi:hypothetical protein